MKICTGPAIIIDDNIGQSDIIDKVIDAIKKHDIPLLKYNDIEEIKKEINNLSITNFIILDWIFYKKNENEMEYNLPTMGSELKEENKKEVINLIKELKKKCLAPIFIISDENPTEIISELRVNGVYKDNNPIYVRSKTHFSTNPDIIINEVENWIENSSHVYITKYWIKELINANSFLFHELLECHPQWPNWYYQSFENDGDDPNISLFESLSFMMLSKFNSLNLESKYFNKKIDFNEKALKKIYKKMVYNTNKDIKKQLKPGDIFIRCNEYFLNIRPECDTTNRVGITDEDDLKKGYFLKGHVPNREEKEKLSDQYTKEYGFKQIDNKIVLFLVDKEKTVVFNKNKLFIKSIDDNRLKKICRLSPIFTSFVRNSYISYLNRPGIPLYPTTFIPSLL